jgi:predicted Zn-dependent peptidase
MASDFLFRPYLVDGAFLEEYVESEKKNLCDRIEAEINNKGSYALKRLIDVMCEKESYSVSALGTVESVSAITAKSLTEFYYGELAKAPVEIFFVGTCDEDALKAKLCEVFTPYARKALDYTASTVIEEVAEIKRVVRRCR